MVPDTTASTEPQTEAVLDIDQLQETDPEAEGTVLQKAVEYWTDVEVTAYYDTYLAAKPVPELTAKELQITVRYGDIAKNRREAAEQTGFEAELEAIRRQVLIQVERYAVAALLDEYQKRAFPELARGEEVAEAQLIVRFGDREISLTASDLATAYGSFANAKVRDFNKLLESVLTLVKSAATQQRHRIERSKGRDWSKRTSDIRWSALITEMRYLDSV
ncbi:MAG: hypothetical protein IPM36_18655 [Lewinellaceae bacterium]|nr:hypothetical protein [Lewinellaceae bacterium]